MPPEAWPSWLDHVWAKSPPRGGTQGETLAQHTWETLERLADFARLRPGLPGSLGLECLWRVLFWGAFLHDFGKVAAKFQEVLRNQGRWEHRHEVLSLAFLDWVVLGFSQSEQPWLVAAVASHHKDASELAELYDPPEDPEEDQLLAAVADLPDEDVRGLWRWLQSCSQRWVNDLGFDRLGVSCPPMYGDASQALALVRQSGVQRVHHWLRVYQRFVRQLRQGAAAREVTAALALRGHIINADHSASAHAGPLPRPRFDADRVLASRGLTWANLDAHQVASSETPGSAVLIAPTGSGKTEAGLLWAAAQGKSDGSPSRLFYTLPYQASMNAMKLRLDSTFGPADVGLQHGRSLLSLYRMLLEEGDDPRETARNARRARDLARLNYPPVRVLSPYQILKAMYRLKGYEAQLSDYHGAVFIFDEIHAYEPARLAMILETVAYLRENYGASFFVMSATLPTLVRERLKKALDAPTEIVADAAAYERFRRHRLHLLDGEVLTAGNLQRIAADARAGKSVLVVCNVVRRAQEVYGLLRRLLTHEGSHVELLHGRFHLKDRLAKEALVRESAGLASTSRRPVVLVATQVVEVSLDVDFDTVYSDPAPLEALVQRLGRVNRRGRHGDLAPVHIFREPADGQGIYSEELVGSGLRVLEKVNGREVDESAVGDWLDEAYAGAAAVAWEEEYEHSAGEFSATCVTAMRPFDADPALEDLFYRAFDSIEVLPADLHDDFFSLQDSEPIRANELLVPISWRRYCALRGLSLATPRDGDTPPVVHVPYNSELGLLFEGSGSSSEDDPGDC
ncbi:MAG: CRISPR-associated helicase Cas3' [Anaerolineae bacterium]|nr:CRISPR-associated helicase Cas3' [Anaerolineae bacterium]